MAGQRTMSGLANWGFGRSNVCLAGLVDWSHLITLKWTKVSMLFMSVFFWLQAAPFSFCFSRKPVFLSKIIANSGCVL